MLSSSERRLDKCLQHTIQDKVVVGLARQTKELADLSNHYVYNKPTCHTHQCMIVRGFTVSLILEIYNILLNTAIKESKNIFGLLAKKRSLTLIVNVQNFCSTRTDGFEVCTMSCCLK